MSNFSAKASWRFAIVPEPMAHHWLTFDRQVAELQVRIAVLNRYTALGRPVNEPVGYIRPGKGAVRSEPDLCNRASEKDQRRRHHLHWGLRRGSRHKSSSYEGHALLFETARL